MSKISSGQLALAFIVTRLSAETVMIPAELIRYGADRFWSILAAKIAVMILFVPIILLTLKFRGDNFLTASVRRNRIYGTTLGILFALVLTATALETLVNLQLYISDVIFDSIGFITGAAIITGAALYGAVKGVSAVTRTSVFAFAVFIVLAALIILTMSDKMDINNLYISRVQDESYFISSFLSEVSTCSELLIFCVLCGNIRGKPYKTPVYYTLAILAALELLNLIYNLILGPYLTDVQYPLYFISSLSDIVVFQRLDGIDAIVWVMCGIIKLALLFSCVHSIYNTVNTSKYHKNGTVFIIIYAVCISLAGAFIGTNKWLSDIAEDIMHTALPLVFAGTFIPLLVLLTGKKAERKEIANED